MQEQHSQKSALNGNAHVDMGPKTVEVDLPAFIIPKIDEDILDDPVRLKEHVTEAAVFGIDAYYRAKAVQDTSYVDKAISGALDVFAHDAGLIPNVILDELLKVVGTDEGQALQPVIGGLTQIVEDIEVNTDTLNQSLNLDSKSSLLSQAFDGVNQMLDPSSEGSIQQTMDQAVAEIAEKDGVLANTVKDVVDAILKEKLSPLETNIKAIDTYIKVKEGVELADANSPKKGAPHEKNVHIAAKKWVEALGGAAIHTGGDNQPGDHVLEVPMLMGKAMRIVVESKDQPSKVMGTKSIGDALYKCMLERKCETGLWVNKTEEGLSPTQIGTWGLGRNPAGNWLATTFDNLTTALTYLRAMETIRRAKAENVNADIDLKALMALCDSIRNKVKKAQNIITKAGQIGTTASEIRKDADDLRTEIRDSVADIESLIKSSMKNKAAI